MQYRSELDIKISRAQVLNLNKTFHLTVLLVIFIVSAVLALADTEIDVPADAGVVNNGVLAPVDIDPDGLNDADKPGPGSLLPGPDLSAGQHSSH